MIQWGKCRAIARKDESRPDGRLVRRYGSSGHQKVTVFEQGSRMAAEAPGIRKIGAVDKTRPKVSQLYRQAARYIFDIDGRNLYGIHARPELQGVYPVAGFLVEAHEPSVALEMIDLPKRSSPGSEHDRRVVKQPVQAGRRNLYLGQPRLYERAIASRYE